MDNFFINRGATIPSLRLELTYDGKYDFMKQSHFYNAIQNADVTFSMWDEHDVLKISDQPCTIILTNQDTCDEQYVIEYKWKTRDTKKPGHYKGKIKILFNDDINEEGVSYEGGTYIGPIYEDLDIFIK